MVDFSRRESLPWWPSIFRETRAIDCHQSVIASQIFEMNLNLNELISKPNKIQMSGLVVSSM